MEVAVAVYSGHDVEEYRDALPVDGVPSGWPLCLRQNINMTDDEPTTFLLLPLCDIIMTG